MSGKCPDCGGDTFAEDGFCRQCGVPLPIASVGPVKAGNVALHQREEPNAKLLESILDAIEDTLFEQKEQTKILEKMNSVIQLWGILLILGIIGGCISMVFGFGWLSW